MTKLELVVQEFLERGLLAEKIDDLLTLTQEQRARPKADYFLRDRSVIVELKDLVDDREQLVRGVLADWHQRPGWPTTYRDFDIQDFLKLHPQRAEINRDLSGAFVRSLENVVRDANAQIRSTRSTFALPDAQGVLFLVNDSVDLLDPKVVGTTLSHLLARRDVDGSPRFPHVESIVVFSTAHTVAGVDGSRHLVIQAVLPPGIDPTKMHGSFEDLVMEQWAAFLGKPLERREVITRREELDLLNFVSKRPPLEF